MARAMIVDLFVEDQAHEQFVSAVVRRLAKDNNVPVEMHARCARGGHGRVISELGLYQRGTEQGLGLLARPDILVVAIDANCKRLPAARREILGSLQESFKPLTAIACPDPHVERWYVADPASFKTVVGVAPRCARRKCERRYYKKMLSEAVTQAGHVSTLGGIEFAAELVEAMDLDRAAQSDRSLKDFLDDIKPRLKLWANAG